MADLAITVIDHLACHDLPAIRRVYNLPVGLHGRLINYMAAKGYDNEVEAVRKLLAMALDQFETADHLYSRLSKMQASEAAIAACGHPQVDAYQWSDDRNGFAIFFTNGRVLRFLGEEAQAAGEMPAMAANGMLA